MVILFFLDDIELPGELHNSISIYTGVRSRLRSEDLSNELPGVLVIRHSHRNESQTADLSALQTGL